MNWRSFWHLMFKTAIGVTEDSSSTCYLRPETAQGIFVNFANIQRTTRRKLPFGVCQVGKAFRNEITPGNFTFRTREFEQMECEFFCKPGTDLEWFAYWKDYCMNWLLSLGIKEENLRLRDHEPAELAFYSRATTDIEYAFPFTDWGELWGIADRTNYDLSRHQEASGKIAWSTSTPRRTSTTSPTSSSRPLGCDRVALAFLCEAYDEEHLTDSKGKEDIRTVLHLHPALAPYKCAVLPLSKKLGEKAMEIRNELSKYFMVDYDDTGSIGKRYRREDEIGTPFCITVDFDTVGDEAKGIAADNCVTGKLYRDAVTGAYNERYYQEKYRSRILTAGVAVLRVDDFKAANDVYGRYAGNSVLETVAGVLRRNLGEKDRLIRRGEDRLLLLLPEVGQSDFGQKLEHLRLQLAAAGVPGYSHLHISVSIGGVWIRDGEVSAAVEHAERLATYAQMQKNTVITEQQPERTAAAPVHRRQSVLIVDDSELNRKMLGQMLGSRFDIAEAASGEACLQLLEQNATGISIVLLDIHMPGIDGFTVLEEMNQKNLLEQIPVIMISSEDTVDAVRRAFDLGASDYISRPFDAKVVYQRIINTIQLYAKQRRLSAMAADLAFEKERASRMMIGILSQVVEKRNGESRDHVQVSASAAQQAWKAQAVAVHSYLEYHKQYGSSTNALIYTPVDQIPASARNAIRKAVQAVKDEVLVYNGSVCDAVWSASAGYNTQTGVYGTCSSRDAWGTDVPYLQSVESPYEEQYHNKLRRVIGKDYTYIEYNDSRTGEPYQSADTTHKDLGGFVQYNTFVSNGRSYRYISQFVSSRYCFDFGTDASGTPCMTYYGYGHGVGMSQCGAVGYAAEEGMNYKQILQHYYTGAKIRTSTTRSGGLFGWLAGLFR